MINHNHFSSQCNSRRNDTIVDKLERAEKSAAKFRAKYRNLKKFLLEKGVSAELFDEYNSQFNAEYERDSMA